MRVKRLNVPLSCAVLVSALLFSLAAGAETKPASAPTVRPRASASDVAAMAQADNAFAVDIYRKLSAKKGNLFLSPSSIFAALSMTASGARGQTEAEMAATLHYSIERGRVHPAVGALLYDMAAQRNPKVRLAIANALWAQKSYPFLDTYLNPVRANYAAGLRNLDFAGAPERARKTINKWVEERTQNKIRELLKKGVINSGTRLVLTNAIYFKADWAKRFKTKDTRDANFRLLDGKTVRTPLMYRKAEHVGYAEIDKLQALALPYAGKELSMIVLLPRGKDGLPALEKRLSAKALKKIMAQVRRKREVRVYLPRFKVTTSFSLKKVLVSLGMREAFSTSADFSGMTGKRDLFITAVVHKAFVDVNEEGTEAAAATGVAVGLTAMPMKPTVFRADHPFLFLITHNKTGSILFMGRCVNPMAAGE